MFLSHIFETWECANRYSNASLNSTLFGFYLNSADNLSRTTKALISEVTVWINESMSKMSDFWCDHWIWGMTVRRHQHEIYAHIRTSVHRRMLRIRWEGRKKIGRKVEYFQWRSTAKSFNANFFICEDLKIGRTVILVLFRIRSVHGQAFLFEFLI
jgi:hypothetical protein